MTKWFLFKEEESDEHVWAGYGTIGIQGLWKLFIVGKVMGGSPSEMQVKLTPRETRVFKMVVKAGFVKKRKIWLKFLYGKLTQKEMLSKLEEELPIWILGRKLSNERK